MMENSITYAPPARRYTSRFPGAATPAPRVAESVPQPMGNEIKKLLIVDDDPYFRSLMTVMLGQLGIAFEEIREAENSHAAINTARTNPVDLVFCDLNLPLFRSQNGLEVVKTLRAEFPRLPIYMVTADSSETTVESVRSAGANGHILKPISLRVLKRLMQSIAEQPEGN